MADLQALAQFLRQGKAKEVKEIAEQAIAEGTSAKEVLQSGLMAGMDVIGKQFKNNEIFVPEVLIAARAMNAGMEILKPHLAQSGVEAKGTVVIGTVKGDLHDIGKNLVAMMMEGKGLTVIDLGTDVSPARFVEEAQAKHAQIIACSALLTTTMKEMEQVVKAVESSGLRNKVQIMVGGAPVTESFCKSIGADAYSPDAATASETAVELCSAG